jgi:hypothetical protein
LGRGKYPQNPLKIITQKNVKDERRRRKISEK